MATEQQEYILRLAGESINVLIYAVFYAFSWVILVARGVLPSFLRRVGANKQTNTNREQFPLLPATILIFCNVLCFHRLFTQALIVVYDALAVSSVGKIEIILHIQTAIAILGYVLCHIIFAMMLVLWTKKMMGLLAFSQLNTFTKLNILFYVFTYVVAITSSIMVVIFCAPPFVVYISLQGLKHPELIQYTQIYTTFPIGILMTLLLCFLLFVIGIAIIAQLCKKSSATRLTTKVKSLIMKLSIAVVALPAGNLIRALGLVLLGIDIKTFSYVQSIFLVVSLPDILILSAIFFCFWPYAFCCCGAPNPKLGTRDSQSPSMTRRGFLRTLFQPIENQDYEEEDETVSVPVTPFRGSQMITKPVTHVEGRTRPQNLIHGLRAPVSYEVVPSPVTETPTTPVEERTIQV